MSQTKGAGDDGGPSSKSPERPVAGDSAARRESAGAGATGPSGEDGASSDPGDDELDPLLSTLFLRTLHRDLYTLSAVVRRILEQAPVEADPNSPVTVDQMRVLRYVTRNPRLRVGELAARLGMKPPSASAALDRLESKRLVTREAGLEDQRTVFIEPSAEGRELVREVQSRVERKLASSLARMERDDLARLPELLRRLVGAIMEEEASFSDLCHHCGPGYDASCAIHRLYGNCPYAKTSRTTST